MSKERTGKCMCGAVRFTATDAPDRFGACHCEMCRRWTGSAFLGVSVPMAGVSWQGTEHIGKLQSSDWAERAFCTKCGSPLYYHVTLDNPMAAGITVPLGAFDDPDGFSFDREIFIDCKPDSFAYAGEGRTTMTRAEVFAMYAPKEGGE